MTHLRILYWNAVWWAWLKVDDYRYRRMMRQWDKERMG